MLNRHHRDSTKHDLYLVETCSPSPIRYAKSVPLATSATSENHLYGQLTKLRELRLHRLPMCPTFETQHVVKVRAVPEALRMLHGAHTTTPEPASRQPYKFRYPRRQAELGRCMSSGHCRIAARILGRSEACSPTDCSQKTTQPDLSSLEPCRPVPLNRSSSTTFGASHCRLRASQRSMAWFLVSPSSWTARHSFESNASATASKPVARKIRSKSSRRSKDVQLVVMTTLGESSAITASSVVTAGECQSRCQRSCGGSSSLDTSCHP